MNHMLPSPFDAVPRIGMGCWAIGGPFWAGDDPCGWSGTNDAASCAALEAAWDAGVRLFDTAAVYGTGHSETLIGEVLRKREAVIVSKIGLEFDAATKQLTGERFDPAFIAAQVESSRQRLRRDRIDVVLLHPNEASHSDANGVFDALEEERAAGHIGAYGWSTDFPLNVAAQGEREGFVAVQHASNVLMDVPSMAAAADAHGLAQMVRSPLAMGLLTSKYDGGRTIEAADVRNHSGHFNDWFSDRAATPAHIENIAALRDLLTVGGRTLAQGALGWLLARSPRMIPVPGAKNAAQSESNAAAIELGPLPADTMAEIERVLDRPPEGPPRAR